MTTMKTGMKTRRQLAAIVADQDDMRREMKEMQADFARLARTAGKILDYVTEEQDRREGKPVLQLVGKDDTLN